MGKMKLSLKIKFPNADQIIGAGLLIIFFVIGLLTIFWRPFVDEADNLVTGWLISQGNLLYKDIFSHHFPFAYYWVAAIVTLFGKSIFAVRFSILFFQTMIFAISMRFYQKWTLIGVVALCWGIFRLFYRGNVVLYSSISGPCLFALFVITFVIIRKQVYSKIAIFTIAVVAVIAFLSDPLSIYPIIIAYIFLFINHPRKAFLSGVFFAGILGLYLLYLLVTGTFSDFWQHAIYFNQAIYNKYTSSSALRIGSLLETTAKGLNLFNPAWLNFDPFYQISLQSTKFDSWAFTGFFYRFLIIIGTITLAIQRKFRSAIFIYLYCAATITISPWEFRAQGLILVTLFIAVVYIFGDLNPDISGKLFTKINWLLRAIVATALIWVVVHSSAYLYDNRTLFSYDNTFRQFENSGVHIRGLGCNLPDVLLISYPGGIYNYWFSGYKPVAGYEYMWPWVAEVGLTDVIQTLNQPGTLAIAIREDSIVWGIYDTQEYLAPLDDLLGKIFIARENGTYISPELAKMCDHIP